MKRFISGIVFTLFIILVVGVVIAKEGYVNFRADQAPSKMEATIAMAAVDASTDRNSPDRKNPIQPTDKNLIAGAKVYVNNCEGCHGGPRDKSSEFGRAFYPPAPQFFTDAPDMPDNQNYYIIKHGIRWTGMPAWDKTLDDQKIWQVVTFMAHIEKLPAPALRALEPAAQ